MFAPCETTKSKPSVRGSTGVGLSWFLLETASLISKKHLQVDLSSHILSEIMLDCSMVFSGCGTGLLPIRLPCC